VVDKQTRIAVSYNGKMVDTTVTGGLSAALVALKLEEIQHGLFEKARKFRDDYLVTVS
jgi:hypothetical protein